MAGLPPVTARYEYGARGSPRRSASPRSRYCRRLRALALRAGITSGGSFAGYSRGRARRRASSGSGARRWIVILRVADPALGRFSDLSASRSAGVGQWLPLLHRGLHHPPARSLGHIFWRGARRPSPTRRKIGLVSPAISRLPDLPGLLNDLADLGPGMHFHHCARTRSSHLRRWRSRRLGGSRRSPSRRRRIAGASLRTEQIAHG